MRDIIVFIVIFLSSSEGGKLWDKVSDVGEKAWEFYSRYVPDEFDPLNLVHTNSCIGDLGCFYTGPPFYHPVHRPISLSPSERTNAIYFLLYTPLHTKEEFELRPIPESVVQSVFDPRLDTKIIAHGFLAHLEEFDFRFRLKDAILEHGDYNVIIVDWSELNYPPYLKSVANTRVVGAQLAKLIHCLMDTKDVRAESFHIIGHSLGAQIAGYAGERIENLGRITGLDPAGPWFRYTEPEVRLDPTDAIFVDVIHTDGAEFVTAGFGTNPPLGHVDFYPNGGSAQPGCVLASKMNISPGMLINGTTHLWNVLCDHARANEFFLESVTNAECKFLAVQCSSYEAFESGHCPPDTSLTAEMGFHSEMVPGLEHPAMFYLKTSDKSPFCIPTKPN